MLSKELMCILTLVMRIMQMVSKGTLLGIFVYKEELIVSSSIANQLYLDKINPKQASKL